MTPDEPDELYFEYCMAFEGKAPSAPESELAQRLAIATSSGGPVDPDDYSYLDALHARWPGRFPETIIARAGWQRLIMVMSEMVDEAAPGETIAFSQVKEKFGAIRAYHHRHELKPMADIVRAAGEISERVCEWCGLPGMMRRSPDGYFHTACDRHAIEGSTVSVSPADLNRGPRR